MLVLMASVGILGLWVFMPLHLSMSKELRTRLVLCPAEVVWSPMFVLDMVLLGNVTL